MVKSQTTWKNGEFIEGLMEKNLTYKKAVKLAFKLNTERPTTYLFQEAIDAGKATCIYYVADHWTQGEA